MKFHRLFCLVLLIILAGLSACGGGSYSSNPPPPPPTPVPATPSISSLSPLNGTAGGGAFTLTVNGSNFASGANVSWSNAGNPGFVGGPAMFVSASQLTLQISAADIAIPGSALVVVTVPGNASASNAATFVINPGPAGGGKVISTGANGAAPNGNSHDPVLSFNGRIVAFSSEATNLVVPNTIFPEGYVRDTCLGADSCTPSTLLVSAVNGGNTGTGEGNAQGGATPSIGAQTLFPPAGGFIGFLSTANNLVTPNTNFQQAYVRDTCASGTPPNGCVAATVLASVTQVSGEPNGAASGFMLAGNTCDAVFVSAGTDLLSGVTIPNEIYLTTCGFPLSGLIFENTTLVSASSVSSTVPGTPGDQGGQQPAISSEGRFVAFASTSTNLTNSPNGGVQQIYLRDTCHTALTACTPSTTIVSVDNSGNALAGGSQLPAINDDGRFVVFSTQVTGSSVVNLRDTCNSSSGPVTGCVPSTTAVSVTPSGTIANGPSSSNPHAVSGDGRLVVFSSSASNLIIANPAPQVFVRDTCNSSSGSVSGCTPNTVLISIDGAGIATGGFAPAISEDGHFAAFVTTVGALQQVFLAATGF